MSVHTTVVFAIGRIRYAILTNRIARHAAKSAGILGAWIPYAPDVMRERLDKHPDEAVPDGLVCTQLWPSTSTERVRGTLDGVIQYRHDRARKALRGFDEQANLVARMPRPSRPHCEIQQGNRLLTAAVPLPDELGEALTTIDTHDVQ